MVLNSNTNGDPWNESEFAPPTDPSDLFIPGFEEFSQFINDPVLEFDSIEDWIFDLDSPPIDTDVLDSIPMHADGVEVEKPDGSAPFDGGCGSSTEIPREIGVGSSGPDGSDLKMAGNGISEETHEGSGMETAVHLHQVKTDRGMDEQDGSDSKKVKVEFGVVGSSTEAGVEKMEEDDELEEGEIRESDGEETGRGDEAEGVFEGRSISRSKQEIPAPVPLVDVVLKPHHQTMPVGVVLSVTGTKIIVDGNEKHNPLKEGSILWVTETRSPLGLIDETYVPVRNPYYIIRYNSEKEVPAGIHKGIAVSFVAEFSSCILNDRNLYKKRYNAFDAHVGVSNEAEFSDAEKKDELKKMQQMAKKGKDNWAQGNQQSADWNKVQVREGFHKNAQSSAPPSQGCIGPWGPMGVCQQFVPDQVQQLPHVVPSGSGSYDCSHIVGQIGTDGASVSHMAQPVGYPEGLPQQLMLQVNVVWSNGRPIQQHHMFPPTGFALNEMPYHQQRMCPPSGLEMNGMQQQHVCPPGGFTMNGMQEQHTCPPDVFAIDGMAHQQQHMCAPSVFPNNGMQQQQLDHYQHQIFPAFPNEMPTQSQLNPTQMPLPAVVPPFGNLVGPAPRAMSLDFFNQMPFGMGFQSQGHQAHPFGGVGEQGHSSIGQLPPSSTVQGGFSEPQQLNFRGAFNRGRGWLRRGGHHNFYGRRRRWQTG